VNSKVQSRARTAEGDEAHLKDRCVQAQKAAVTAKHLWQSLQKDRNAVTTAMQQVHELQLALGQVLAKVLLACNLFIAQQLVQFLRCIICLSTSEQIIAGVFF
jgi:hypothetical protein